MTRGDSEVVLAERWEGGRGMEEVRGDVRQLLGILLWGEELELMEVLQCTDVEGMFSLDNGSSPFM